MKTPAKKLPVNPYMSHQKLLKSKSLKLKNTGFLQKLSRDTLHLRNWVHTVFPENLQEKEHINAFFL
jgi:hypothetical protein